MGTKNGKPNPGLIIISLACCFYSASATAIDLFAAVLPSSRSVQVGDVATAFASVINVSGRALENCGIDLIQNIPVELEYYALNSSNEIINNTPNVPIEVPSGGIRGFVFAVAPLEEIPPTTLTFSFFCDDADPAPISPANEFLFSASITPIPDILAIGATLSNDGITNIPGYIPQAVGVMSVAALNLGVPDDVLVRVRPSDPTLPVDLQICQTVPETGMCTNSPSNSVLTHFENHSVGGMQTFTIFATATEAIEFSPATRRILVEFLDSEDLQRGSSATAVRTRELITPDSDQNGIWDDFEDYAGDFLETLGTNAQSTLEDLSSLMLVSQNILLFAELTDFSIDQFNDARRYVHCIYETYSREDASTILAALKISLISNMDRLSAESVHSGQLAGLVFRDFSSAVPCQ